MAAAADGRTGRANMSHVMGRHSDAVQPELRDQRRAVSEKGRIFMRPWGRRLHWEGR